MNQIEQVAHIDMRLISAIISAVIAITIAVANHFIIEPIKEWRRWKKQQLANLYYPVYSLVVARLISTKKVSIDKESFFWGSTDTFKIMDKDTLHELILKNSGYASMELLEAWSEYIGAFPTPDAKLTSQFISVLTKDFNQLKKEIGHKFNQAELETGIPDVIKDLRIM
ncbi:hypothetical protein PVOR_05750 [Paenibacillus vortex V453]|uniref:Uncharacterized protein n=2 Tax=Paenibacillus TaxID=44249 RepID=A0A2R9SZY4_9BACL|nr:hypothetical protein [Paenibacillus vortex]EFU42931.1 hypothetical protein PVOR_05750 [Paenibacillus vortex V453]